MIEEAFLLNYKTFEDVRKLIDESILNYNTLEKGKFGTNKSSLADTINKIKEAANFENVWKNLTNNDKMEYITHAYNYFILDRNIADVSSRLRNDYQKISSYPKSAKKYYLLYMGYLTYKFSLALNNRIMNPKIVISRPIQDKPENITVMIPIVPVKSPFTIYIVSILVDLIEKLTKRKQRFAIEIGWNTIVFEKMMGEDYLRDHFSFAKRGTETMFDNLRPYIEKNFLSFIYDLVHKALMIKGIDFEESMDKIQFNARYGMIGKKKKIYATIIDTYRKHQDFCELFLKDVSAYVPEKFPTIVEYFLQLLQDKIMCNGDKKERILFITPIPVGLVLERITRDIKSFPFNRVYYINYFPFPSPQQVSLPLYVTELSYHQTSGSKEKSRTNEKPFLTSYIKNLLLSSLSELQIVKEDLERMEYDELIIYLARLFGEVDRKQKEYLRYI